MAVPPLPRARHAARVAYVARELQVQHFDGGKATPWDLRRMLSEREREVAAAAALGWNNTVAADLLFISSTTYRTHLYNIADKLGIPGSRQSVHIRVILTRAVLEQNLLADFPNLPDPVDQVRRFPLAKPGQP